MKDSDYGLGLIVNEALRYKFGEDALDGLRAVHVADGSGYAVDITYAVEVTEILGVGVKWKLSPFKIVNIYQYFDKYIIDDLLGKIFCDTDQHANKFTDVTNWMRDDAKELLREELLETIVDEFGLDWDMFIGRVLSEMGHSGFLSAALYYDIVAGYFESLTKKFFTIPLKTVKYSTPQGNGSIKITFLDDNVLKIDTETFFTGCNFFNELTREVTTEKFLSTIRHGIGAYLCNTLII